MPMSRDFRWLWVATSISHLGTMLGAFTLTALLFLDATAAKMAALTAVTTAPALLVTPIAGVWVDRLPRRAVMIVADFGRFCVLLTVAATAVLDVLTMEYLYVSAFVPAASRCCTVSLTGLSCPPSSQGIVSSTQTRS
jgi:MFS family permease